MAGFIARPFQSEIQYQGQYTDLAFDLFAAPSPVYRNLLKFLGRYGTTLRDLRVDTSTVADANISCTLLNLSTAVRYYLDRLEITIAKLHEIGDEAAMQLGLDAWAALQASDPKISLARHGITLAFHGDLVKGTVEELMRQYVTPPKALGDKTTSAVLFYLRDRGEGEEGGSIFLDRSLVKDGALYLKLNLVLNATQVPLEKVRDRVDEFIATVLAQMGIEVERAS